MTARFHLLVCNPCARAKFAIRRVPDFAQVGVTERETFSPAPRGDRRTNPIPDGDLAMSRTHGTVVAFLDSKHPEEIEPGNSNGGIKWAQSFWLCWCFSSSERCRHGRIAAAGATTQAEGLGWFFSS